MRMHLIFAALSLCLSLVAAQDDRSLEYDYIFIGGGTTGLIAAARLTENPNVKVLVLSNGHNITGEPWTDAHFADINTLPPTASPQSEYGHSYEKFGVYMYELHNKATAGASAFNTGFAGRAPFAYWDAIAALSPDFNDNGWNSSSMIQYYKRFERFIAGPGLPAPGPTHGTSGPMPIRTFPREPATQIIAQAAADTIGIPLVDDLDDGISHGVGIMPRTLNYNADGKLYRTTTYDAYIAPIWNREGTGSRSNLDMWELTTAKRILFCKGNSRQLITSADDFQSVAEIRACAVEYDRTGGPSGIVWARKEVVLTAGTASSNMMLQVSGVGDCAHFATLKPFPVPCIYNNPHVGVGVFDNLLIQAAYIVFAPNTQRVPANINYAHWTSQEGQALGETLPDIALAFGMVSEVPGSLFGLPAGTTLPVYGAGAQQYRGGFVGNAPGFIKINDADIHTQPNVTFNTDPSRLVEAFSKIRATMALAKDRGLVSFEVGYTSLYPNVATLINTPNTWTHDWHTHSGVRLGEVVDGRGRVYGPKGVRACDMSVLPLPLPNHSTFTTAMTLGEKCGAQLREDFESSSHHDD